MKQALEYLLFNSGVSKYQIAKDTGISQATLNRYASGAADVGKMSLDNALTLHDYFKGVVEKMENQYGSVNFEGKEYTLLDYAEIGHLQGRDGLAEVHYKAPAIDVDGNEYTVYWNPVEGWQQLEDAEHHCDWDEPAMVESI